MQPFSNNTQHEISRERTERVGNYKGGFDQRLASTAFQACIRDGITNPLISDSLQCILSPLPSLCSVYLHSVLYWKFIPEYYLNHPEGYDNDDGDIYISIVLKAFSKKRVHQ